MRKSLENSIMEERETAAFLAAYRSRYAQMMDILRLKNTADDMDFMNLAESLRWERYSTVPGVACLLHPWNFDKSRGLTPKEQDPQGWTRRLQEDAERATKWREKPMRLFPLCAKTHRLVPCGSHGHGYEISLAEVHNFLDDADGILKIMVHLTSATLGNAAAECFASDIIDKIAKARKIGEDSLFRLMTHVHLRVLPLSSNDEVEFLRGRAYESLRRFLYREELSAKCRKLLALPDNGFVCFEDVMEVDEEDNDSAEVSWILKK